MKKHLTLILLFLSTGVMAQRANKWLQYRTDFYRDTVAKCYVNRSKDSTSQELEKRGCQCNVFSYVDEKSVIKYLPCDHLIKQHYITKYWVYSYSAHYFKGKLIRKDKPRWESSIGLFNTDDYLYYYNGKRVYPVELIKQPKE